MQEEGRRVLVRVAVALAGLAAVIIIGVVFAVGMAKAGDGHGNQLTIYDGHVAKVKGPWGPSWNHDKNGLVPMYADSSTRKLAYSQVGGRGKAWIKYNPQKMRNATPCGWDAMARHEKGHSKGFAHGDGRPPDGDGKKEKGENPAFYPTIPIHCHYPANPDNNFANKY